MNDIGIAGESFIGRCNIGRRREAAEQMEVRLRSGKLIIVEDDRLDEIWKLEGYLTEEEMKEVQIQVQKTKNGFV